MEQFLSDIDWKKFLEYGMLLLTAYVLALPIGWDQEKEQQSAGLRVFPIVAVGSCGYMLLGYEVPTSDNQAHARIIVGLISGVGFIGGGAIIKDSSGENARGVATAASIWVTGAIGAAVAWRQIALAIFLSALILLSHKLMRRARKMAHGGNENAEGEKGNNKGKGQADKEQREGASSDSDRSQPDSSSTGRSKVDAPRGFDKHKNNPKEPEMRDASLPMGVVQASLMGVVVSYKDIALPDFSHRVVVIRDDKGAEYLVDLGPTERFNNIGLENGMYMMIHGWVAMVGNQQGLRATQVHFNGGLINIGT